jgi:hypothetical protein
MSSKEAIKIARICHEANRAYCQTIGDNSQPSWDDAPQWQRTSAINGVDFHVNALKSGTKPSPDASHNSWLEEKRRDGWAYGPTKDPERKLHPCFVEYDKLPAEQRAKDFLFAAIVEAMYTSTVFASLRD